MTPEQEKEWAERRQLVQDFAHGAHVWALRNGLHPDKARMEIARAAVLGVTPSDSKAAA